MALSITLIAKKPTTADAIKPIAMHHPIWSPAATKDVCSSPFTMPLKSDTTKLPRMIGMLIKNENLETDSLSPPASVPAQMVAPLLDMPGKSATTCAKPIESVFFQHKGSVSFLFFA